MNSKISYAKPRRKRHETPVYFDETLNVSGFPTVEYSDLLEICQGGPAIGLLFINGVQIDGLFGGPFLIENGELYVPKFHRRLLSSGFKLVRIDGATLELNEVGKFRTLYFLDQIEAGVVYYFTGVDQKLRTSIPSVA